MVLSHLARRFYQYTKPMKRVRPKIAMTLPKTAGTPETLADGSVFIDLVANPPLPERLAKAPELPIRGGEWVSLERVHEMRRLCKNEPSKWTINALVKRFRVSRAFAINNVLPKATQQAEAQRVDDHIQSMSTRQQRGWIMRHKVRVERLGAW